MRDVAGACVFAAGLLAAAVMGVLSVAEPRLALMAVLLLTGLLVRERTALALLLVSVVSLGLVRRVVSGGRAETDPLLLLPIALLGLALMWSVGRHEREGETRRETMVSLALKVLAVLPLASWSVSERSVPALYVAVLYSACFIAMSCGASGFLPNLSTVVSRAAPWATLAIAGYGLYQYQYLPAWDRSWMVASELRSIGAPVPGEVRIFGSLESPGPYALVLGALMCIVAQGLVRGAGRRKIVLRVAALAAAIPAFFLTGVRTGLVSLALVMVIAAIKTRSAVLITVAAAGGAAVFYVGSRVIANNTETNIFTAERYTDLEDDSSLAARLQLIGDAVPALRNPLGTGFGSSAQRVDNLYVDLLLAVGVLGAIAMAVVAAAVIRRAVSADWRDPRNGLSLAVLYSVTFTFAGSIFATTSGLAIALAWGWVLSNKNGGSASGASGTDPLMTTVSPTNPRSR